MGKKIITLSGAATDVLYTLFFRGALQCAELPSKSGAAELRELGFAVTRYTATEYLKESYFTFLTAEGQEFAIKHLADTRFGKPVDKQYCSAIAIGVELDTSDAQKALDELDDKIRNSDAFKDLKDGWSLEKKGTLIINHGQVFIIDAMIQDGSITKAKIGSEMASNNGSASTTYVMKMGVEHGTDENVEAILKNALKNAAHDAAMNLGVEEGKQQVIFKADRFKVHQAAPAIIGNALVTKTKINIALGDETKQEVIDAVRESDLFASLQASVDAQTASIAALQQALHDAVNDALRNALKPGGILWNARSRGF